MGTTLQVYRELERRVRTTDADALRARWECGRLLLAERGPNGRLRNGRREELANALGISPAEINNRMQLAEKYAEEELANALPRSRAVYFPDWREEISLALRSLRDPRDTPHAPTAPCPPEWVRADFIGELNAAWERRGRES